MSKTKFIMNGLENKVWMETLCKVREHIDAALDKHGEPSLDPGRSIDNLKEELDEVLAEFTADSNDYHEFTAGMEREIRDLVAYGLILLHRKELTRRGWVCTNNNQHLRKSVGNQS